ncbi:MAG: cation-translocating P-type ATPase [Clostridia bacterium]
MTDTKRSFFKVLTDFFANEVKRNITLVSVSAVSLILSFIFKQTGISDNLAFDIAWVAIVLCGVPIAYTALLSLFTKGNIKAGLLVTIAMVASIIVKEYFAAGEVAAIMLLGELLEEATVDKAYSGIQKLIDLTPKTARRLVDGQEEIVAVEEIKVGDIVRVLAGETIAVDGIIIQGDTAVDQSVITGESIPIDKTVGDNVTSGTINQFGVFTFQATSSGTNSSLQRMIALAKQVEDNKAPIVKRADKIATYLVIVALLTAIITGIVTKDLIRGVTILIVFCPCAFALAAPTAIIAGIGNATKHGIIIKSGQSMQRFSQIKTVAFDKTGTLTYGKPEVIGVKSARLDITEQDLLQICALCEQKSEHPLGKAIVKHYLASGGKSQECDNFTLVAGKGVSATIDNKLVLAGKKEYLIENNIVVDDLAEVEQYLGLGATVIYVSQDGLYLGAVALADKARTNAKSVIGELKQLGVTPILLTGDNEQTANNIGTSLDIQQISSNMLPQEKMEYIKSCQKDGLKVCMVGDGVNDSLALRSAYAGLAMGGIGSDIAVDASDAVLVNDNIETIPYLLRISKKTFSRINFNIAFSIVWNIAAVILSMFGIINPVIGALVHNASSLIVVISSVELLFTKFKPIKQLEGQIKA